MSYYGWVNSVNLCGWVGYAPNFKINSKGKRMVMCDIFIPRYNTMPVREGEAREAMEATKVRIIGGESMVKIMKRRRINTGDVLVVTGVLLSFPVEKKESFMITIISSLKTLFA